MREYTCRSPWCNCGFEEPIDREPDWAGRCRGCCCCCCCCGCCGCGGQNRPARRICYAVYPDGCACTCNCLSC